MHFTDDEATEVKAWVVKKLEDISDADSDVLADYVLALIRSDAPNDEIRKASVENLEDFLKENTVKFVDEIFEKYDPKPQEPPASEPAAPPSLPSPSQQTPFNPPFPPSNIAQFGHGHPQPGFGYQPMPPGLDRNGPNASRKRTFNDVSQGLDQSESNYRSGDRPFKVARGRGGRRGGWEGGRGQGPPPLHPYPSPIPPPGFPGMPLLPGFPPFNPNDPMAAMMAFQNMGMGMPPLPMPGPNSPTFAGSPPAKINERCKDYDTKGFCVLGNTCPYQHGPDHLVAPGSENEYDPTKANIVLPANGTNGGSHRGADGGRGRGRGRGDRGGFGPRRNRAEFSHAGPNEDQSITTIVVEQIPEDKFNDQAVREFFSEFGIIVEVTLKPYKHLALVKYDTYAEAKRAWSSPKVIFDNRFVKVYWFKPDPRADAGGPPHQGEPAAAGTPFDEEEFQKQQAEKQKAFEEKLQKRKEAEEQRRQLEKQREELLKKQQEEKEKLMARLGKSTDSAEGSTAGDAPNGKQASDEKTSEQTKALRAQLAALEAEAKSLGIDPSASARGRGRGAGGYRGRGGFYQSYGRGYDPSFSRGGFRGRGAPRGRGGVWRLDNRPKKVAVSGVEFDNARDEAFREYLLGIGDYESIDRNPERPDSIMVSFKQRYLAEQLFRGTTNIPGVGNVEFSWVTDPATSATGSPGPAPGTTAAGGPPDEAKTDGDTVMGNDDSELLHKNTGHEVDYDVAEDDAWAVE